jgi:hypothetical protein
VGGRAEADLGGKSRVRRLSDAWRWAPNSRASPGPGMERGRPQEGKEKDQGSEFLPVLSTTTAFRKRSPTSLTGSGKPVAVEPSVRVVADEQTQPGRSGQVDGQTGHRAARDLAVCRSPRQACRWFPRPGHRRNRPLRQSFGGSPSRVGGGNRRAGAAGAGRSAAGGIGVEGSYARFLEPRQELLRKMVDLRSKFRTLSRDSSRYPPGFHRYWLAERARRLARA